MTCNEALLLISGRIDGENTPEEETALNAHLSDCTSCRALLAAYEELDTGVAQLEEPAPEGLARGVMYRIDKETGKAKKPRRWFIGPGTAIGAVAAVLVLLVGTGVIRLPELEANTDAIAPAAASQSEAYADTELMPDMFLYQNEGDTAVAEGVVTGMEIEKNTSKLTDTIQTRCRQLAQDNTASVLLIYGQDVTYLDTLRQYDTALDTLMQSTSSWEATTGEATMETTYAALAIVAAQTDLETERFDPFESYAPQDTDVAFLVFYPD